MQDGEILQVGNTEDIISNETLDALYGTPIRIEKYEERKICIYY
jgi:ABC-type enterochelin transport system ATPase subunit